MRRNGRFGLVALVWLAAACLPAQAVLLRYTPAVGRTDTYSQTMSGGTDMTMNGRTMHNDMTMKSLVTQKVVAKSAKGVKVEMKVHDATLAMTMPGVKGGGKPQKVPDKTVTMVVNDRGGPQTVSGSGASAGGSDPFSGFGGFSAFPAKEVKPGDSWSDTLKDVGGMKGLVFKYTSRLVSVSPYLGHSCAKIQTTFSGTMPPSMAQGGQGKIQGTSVQYYDYAKSVWVEQEAKLTMTMALTAPKTARGGGTMATKTAMKVKMSLK